jgi:putative hydrolase of the HAD superfamily
MWREVYFYYCRASDEELLETWENDYWETVRRHTRLFPETEAVLGVLKDRYRVGLITNTQGQKAEGGHRIAQYPGLETFFRSIIVAGEGGIPPKPDPQPFYICLEQLGVEPAAAVYVGDDWRIDIGGARAAGLWPVWLKHHSVRRNWPGGDGEVPIITDLEALLDLDDLMGHR